MKSNWQRVRLEEILTERAGKPDINAILTGEIPIVAKIGFDSGKIVLREQAQTKTNMILIKPGDLVISGINAEKGAVAIYSEENKGDAAATIHYSSYIINKAKADAVYLWYFMRSRVFKDILTNNVPSGIKTELKPKRFLPIEIPLPSLDEQKHIVARIEELAAKIEEARGLRQQAIEGSDSLITSYLEKILNNVADKNHWEFGTISQFAEINPSRQGKVNLKPTDQVSFVPMRAVDDEKGIIAWPEIKNFLEASKGYTWFLEGDVIFARITPCMQNGKAALAENLVNGVGFGSTEFHVVRPGPKVLGRWIHALVRQKSFRENAAAHFKGTAGQQRVPQSFLEQKIIAVPPLPEQHRIVAYLDNLQAKVDSVKHLQSETAAELDALLPSILDKAFKGEL